jgi:hypothetical protein
VLGGRPTVLAISPAATTLRALLQACGASSACTLVLDGEIVTRAMCTDCHRVVEPYVRAGATTECEDCGGGLVSLRRTARVAWDAVPPALADRPAARWLRRGDVFAIVDDETVRVFAIAAPPLPLAPGRAWVAADGERFVRLPRAFDLARVRSLRLAIVGLGNVGGAALAQLAPLPWAGVVLVDRDRLEPHNLQAHALAARAALGDCR